MVGKRLPDAVATAGTLRACCEDDCHERVSQVLQVLQSLHTVSVAHVLRSVDRDCGRTPLHWAAIHGAHECLEVLLRAASDAGVDAELINLQDADGNTLLHLAAEAGDASCIDQLLEHPSVDANMYNDKGMTPLTVSLCEGCPVCNESLLLSDKVDVLKPDLDGETPLDVAIAVSHRAGGDAFESANNF